MNGRQRKSLDIAHYVLPTMAAQGKPDEEKCKVATVTPPCVRGGLRRIRYKLPTLAQPGALPKAMCGATDIGFLYQVVRLYKVK